MIFILDTCTLSDLIREHPVVLAKLAAMSAGDRVATCTIVRGEILHGLRRLAEGRKRRDLEEKALEILAGFPCESILPEIADCYAGVKASQEKRGVPLDENDLWIAATAMCLQATIVTRDKDFFRVEGLVVEDWTK